MFPVVVVRDFPSRPKAKNQSCKISVTTCHTAILTPTLQALLSSQFAFDLLIVSLDHATPYISLHRTSALEFGIQVFPYVPTMLPKEN
jgi:hypothetical protein